MEEQRVLLSEKELPRRWYNIIPDLSSPPPPPIHPGTGQPISPHDLEPLFPRALIHQEGTHERYMDIPEPVRDVYRLWRPTPLYRARRLERAVGTPARIYYKYEGGSPPGSHKANTALAQAFYNKEEGVKRLTTETGAGQWGSALAFACRLFGLECKVYMVKASYHQKPYRRTLMETWGAGVVPSPSADTNFGRKTLEEAPDSPGSLGIAISEAVADALTREDTKYSLGSVLNHVLLHQTVVGEEALRQMEMAGEFPDMVIGCVGGGSNFAGLAFSFLRENGKEGRARFIAVEPVACPSLTRGGYAYDFGDAAATTPLLKMYTLGHKFVPPPIHAGGLRYHGLVPLVSLLYSFGRIEARAYSQTAVFQAAVQFAQEEGFLPAPETAHAVKAALDEAMAARESGRRKVILFNFSGHFDLSAYEECLRGTLGDPEYQAALAQKALQALPKVSP